MLPNSKDRKLIEHTGGNTQAAVAVSCDLRRGLLTRPSPLSAMHAHVTLRWPRSAYLYSSSTRRQQHTIHLTRFTLENALLKKFI